MKPSVQLHIPEPCHESWDRMLPAEKGRFCQACSKQVVDFSTMTDQQILRYLSQVSGNVCGRLATDQLRRPLQPAVVQHRKHWWLSALMPLLLFTRVAAQKKATPVSQVSAVSNRNPILLGKLAPAPPALVTISGRVTDTAHQPIPSAVVSAEGLNVDTITDESGYFSLQVHAAGNNTITLHAAAPGYEQVKLQLHAAATVKQDICLPFSADQPEVHTVLAGGITVYNSKIKEDTGAALVHQLMGKPVFSVAVDTDTAGAQDMAVFPNPVTHAKCLTVISKKATDFILQVFNDSGELLLSNYYSASKKLSVQLPVTPRWGTGIFYVCMTDQHSKRKYTKKILVQ